MENKDEEILRLLKNGKTYDFISSSLSVSKRRISAVKQSSFSSVVGVGTKDSKRQYSKSLTSRRTSTSLSLGIGFYRWLARIHKVSNYSRMNLVELKISIASVLSKEVRQQSDDEILSEDETNNNSTP